MSEEQHWHDLGVMGIAAPGLSLVRNCLFYLRGRQDRHEQIHIDREEVWAGEAKTITGLTERVGRGEARVTDFGGDLAERIGVMRRGIGRFEKKVEQDIRELVNRVAPLEEAGHEYEARITSIELAMGQARAMYEQLDSGRRLLSDRIDGLQEKIKGLSNEILCNRPRPTPPPDSVAEAFEGDAKREFDEITGGIGEEVTQDASDMQSEDPEGLVLFTGVHTSEREAREPQPGEVDAPTSELPAEIWIGEQDAKDGTGVFGTSRAWQADISYIRTALMDELIKAVERWSKTLDATDAARLVVALRMYQEKRNPHFDWDCPICGRRLPSSERRCICHGEIPDGEG